MDGQSIQLTCPACGWSAECEPQDLHRRLQSMGMLRRTKQIEWDLLLELCKASSDRMLCDDCKGAGLAVETVWWDDDQWPEIRLCEVCRQPLADERLDVFPDAKRCAICQDAGQTTDSEDEPEFCSRCGGLMIMRQSRRAGLTRYEMVCGECGR